MSPEYTEADVAAQGKSQQLSIPPLVADLKSLDFTHVTQLRCPVVLFLGRYDNTVTSTVAAQWYAHLTAPTKRLVWFEHSAHEIHLEEPGRVLVHLVNDVLPLAQRK